MNTISEKELARKLREKYIKNPPVGMTADMIKRMSDSDHLHIDYFLHEEDLFDEDAGVEGFYIF